METFITMLSVSKIEYDMGHEKNQVIRLSEDARAFELGRPAYTLSLYDLSFDTDYQTWSAFCDHLLVTQ